MQVTTVVLDLAKNIFQVHGVTENGEVAFNQALRRAQLFAFFEKLPPCLVGMEACGSSHYWARQLSKLGHDVRPIPAMYVKPYVKRGKSDAVDAAAICEGFEIDGITQEGGAGQLEINLIHGDPVRLADEVFYFKRLIREAALRHDCYATFMAKPIANEPGSAMHIHHSVLDATTGKNIFSGPQGGETDAFYHFIAGMQNHMPDALAVIAPYVNSYRRYVKDHAAPINLEWGRDNRTTGIRVPLSGPASRRVENRLAGMDCNPYLGIAASLACGYLGLMEQKKPKAEFKGDAYDGDGDIPQVLGSALDLFEEATTLHEVLGPEFARVYAIVKRAEYEEFLHVISPWEREHLLMNV